MTSCPLASNSAVCFLPNRNLLLSEPICGSSFERRINCVQCFLLRLSFSCFHGSSWVAEAGEFGCTTTGNLGDAQVFCLCAFLPFQPTGWVLSLSWGNVVTPGGMVRPWGRMCPALCSALAGTAHAERGTADCGDMVKTCILCSLTARCLHLGTSALLTLHFNFFFPNFPSQRHVLPTCPGLGCVPAAPGRCSAVATGSVNCGNWVFLMSI